ncbi:hypothetical protein SAMN05444161_0025 [Rhizobiales bacterium GAS191]|nr:hypothetical protein SAMN05444161_0025 [Rhizobiales bacterium GAS191]
MATAALPGFSISYAKAESALARMHGLAPGEISAWRSRYGALQRGGLLGSANRPGKGASLDYQPDVLHRMMFSLELVQLGFVPSAILRLIADHWDGKLRDIFSKAESAIVHGHGTGDDVILILAGLTLAFGDEPIPNIQATTLAKLPTRLTFGLDGEHLAPRLLLINLTAQLRKFHTALAYYHLLPEIVSLGERNSLTHTTKKRPPRSRMTGPKSMTRAPGDAALPAPRRRAKTAAPVTREAADG